MSHFHYKLERMSEMLTVVTHALQNAEGFGGYSPSSKLTIPFISILPMAHYFKNSGAV
jgi:hypothetical protein